MIITPIAGIFILFLSIFHIWVDKESLAFLNDDEMYEISTEIFSQGIPEAEKVHWFPEHEL